MSFESELLEIRQETPTVRVFRFAVPQEFDFRPGQYISLEMQTDSGVDSRPMSISTSPTKRGYIEIAKRIGESDFSKKLHEIKKRFKATISGPFGSFVLDGKGQNIILLAGGIGVTPFRSMIEYAADKNLPDKITLFYSNRTPDEIAFRDELHAIEKAHKNIRIFMTITRPEGTNWAGLTGRLNQDMIKKHAGMDGVFYVAGPPAMVDAMVAELLAMNIPKERIRLERFTGY